MRYSELTTLLNLKILYLLELRISLNIEDIQSVFTELKQGILISEVDTDKILRTNKTFIDLIGYSEEEIKNKSFIELIQKIGLQNSIIKFSEKSQRNEIYQEEINLNNRYGKPLSTELLMKPIVVDNNQLILTIFNFLEDKVSKNKLEMIFQTVNACNSTLLEVNDLPTLTKNITGHIVNFSDAKVSILSLLSLDDKQELNHVAISGVDTDSISDEIISVNNSNIATALDYGVTIVIDNIESDEMETPIDQQFVEEQDIKSVLLIPLHAENITFGVISIFSTYSNSFPQIIIDYYNSLGDNLSKYIVKLLFEEKVDEEDLSLTIDDFIHNANNILTGFNGIIASIRQNDVDETKLDKLENTIDQLSEKVIALGNKQRKSIEKELNIVEGSRENVLLVDDDYGSRKLVKEVLVSKDYTVISTSTSTEAIELFKEHKAKIDLVITDVVMPEVNGIDLAKKIREIKPNISLIFISGYHKTPFVNDELDTLNAPFLQKPFKPAKLLEVIKSVIH